MPGALWAMAVQATWLRIPTKYMAVMTVVVRLLMMLLLSLHQGIGPARVVRPMVT